jgi:hypothetical protein
MSAEVGTPENTYKAHRDPHLAADFAHNSRLPKQLLRVVAAARRLSMTPSA